MKMPFIVLVLTLVSAAPACADPPKVAVFDFELVDTSLQGEMYGPRSDEHDRLLHAGEQLRNDLAASGRFQVIDIAPVNAAAHGSNLQACGGCDVRFGEKLGLISSIRDFLDGAGDPAILVRIEDLGDDEANDED